MDSPFERKPPHPPSREPADGPNRDTERPGIFGLETEYAVLFLRDSDGEEGPPPSFDLVQEILFQCLLEGRHAARSSGLKGGYFLENGGLVHMEIFLRNQGDTPILEVATPECRSPLDAITYSRAYDAILEETSRRSMARLEAAGYRGRLVFGKNNTDARGTGFGCHENYLVYHRPGKPALWLFFLCAPLILAALVPAFLILVTVLTAVYLVVAAAHLIPPLVRLAELAYRRLPRWVIEHGRIAGYFVLTVLLLPAVALYSFLLRHLALRPFIRGLTPFLVTRQILTGSGSLNFKHGIYELSQRASLTRSIARIIMFGRQKTIYDLKGLLYDPWEIVRPQKKLTVTLGDSNLSDTPGLLKIGTTALIIEMIEAGVTFDDLQLAQAIRDFREVSRGGPWKHVELRSGASMTALDLQREYLRRASAFHQSRPAGKLNTREILDLWEEMLETLADRPQALSDSLDWVAKKTILDQAVLARGNWKTFFAWGSAFDAAGLEAVSRAIDLRDLKRLTPFHRRWRLARILRSRELDEADFDDERDLYFQARKIDLRFHELSDGGGYQRRLEDEGQMHRLVDLASVQNAVTQAPLDTRARVRGFYIRLGKTPDSVQANWHEVELQSPARHVPIPDPFFCRLPTDGPGGG